MKNVEFYDGQTDKFIKLKSYTVKELIEKLKEFTHKDWPVCFYNGNHNPISEVEASCDIKDCKKRSGHYVVLYLDLNELWKKREIIKKKNEISKSIKKPSTTSRRRNSK